LLLTSLLLALALPAAMPRVELAKDGQSFVLAPSGQSFVPWGLNYGHHGKLIEDIWETDWPAIEKDWRDMKAMGANVVRVHLQYAKFMDAPDRPTSKAFDRLAKLLELSESTGLYLDLTGLACYRTADVPRWYDAMDESARWATQAKFWEAVASRCKSSPAVFCYDLMNEPLAPGADPRKPGQYYSGKPFGGYDFLQWISLDARGRPRAEVARRWIDALTEAIHKHDTSHLITVGLLPWDPKWGHLSGFDPATVAPGLDFMSVHIYPESKKVDEALKGMARFSVGKPLVIE
jgi:hypothetical protein